MAPVVRPDQKVQKLDKPPPPKELVAPKELPKDAAPEADPSRDKGVAVYGEPGKGDPAGLEGGVAKGGRLGGIAGGVVDLPAGAKSPARVGGPLPQYPRQAKAAELEGTVVLRIIVLADGSVSKVDVVSGEEPFVGAAVRAVKAWRYRPAMMEGQPIAVFHTVRIPFTLDDEDEG
jgi:protein TonB